MKSFRFLCLPLILVFIFNSVFAQKPEARTDAEKEKARAAEREKEPEVEKKSIAMLGEIIAGADTLRLPVNRISIYALAGVLLWKYDSKQARATLNTAAQEIVNLQNAADEEQSEDYQFKWQMQEIRRQMAQSLAPHDAEFALGIYRQTRPAEITALMQSPKNLFPNGNDYNRVQNEINTEQMLANEISRQDPKKAIKMAHELLEKGVSYAVFDLVERIREKEPEEAARLADDILRKFQDLDFSVSHNERNLAINFLSRLTVEKPATENKEKSKFVVNETILRALTEKLAAFFLRDPQTENYYYLLPSFIQVAEKFSTSRASQLRQREKEIRQKRVTMNPFERVNQLNETSDAETLIKEAQTAPSEAKTQYYSYAANKLVNSENPERARAVINMIPERRARDYAVQSLVSNLFYKAVSAGKFDEARGLAVQSPNKTQQVSLYIHLFNYLRQKNEEKLARQILDEAAALVPSSPENSGEMMAIFQLSGAYADVAPEKSLTMMESTVGKLNELLNASILLNRFSGGENNSADEITLPFFNNSIRQYGFYFNQPDFVRLAAANFERTKNLADGFQRPEARIFTRLMIVQAILSQSRTNNGNTDGEIYELPRGRTFRSTITTRHR